MSWWQVGDLALCIERGPKHCKCGCLLTGELCPEVGTLSEVALISRCDEYDADFSDDSCDAPVLVFSTGKEGDASRFRKVTPNTDVTGFEEPRRIPVGEDA